MKKCTRCKKRKDLLDFYKKGGSKTGVLSECKDCTKWRTTQTTKKHQQGIGTKTPTPKVCTGCKELKGTAKYDKDSRTIDGLVNRCKVCVQARSTIFYQNHQEQHLTQCAEWRSTHKDQQKQSGKTWYANNREKVLAKYQIHGRTPKGRFTTAKSGAKQRNRVFTLTEEQFIALIAANCFVSTCKEEVTGLDRTDSSKGYILSNVRASCEYHNKMKSDLTDREFYTRAKEVVLWYEGRK